MLQFHTHVLPGRLKGLAQRNWTGIRGVPKPDVPLGGKTGQPQFDFSGFDALLGIADHIIAMCGDDFQIAAFHDVDGRRIFRHEPRQIASGGGVELHAEYYVFGAPRFYLQSIRRMLVRFGGFVAGARSHINRNISPG